VVARAKSGRPASAFRVWRSAFSSRFSATDQHALASGKQPQWSASAGRSAIARSRSPQRRTPTRRRFRAACSGSGSHEPAIAARLHRARCMPRRPLPIMLIAAQAWACLSSAVDVLVDRRLHRPPERRLDWFPPGGALGKEGSDWTRCHREAATNGNFCNEPALQTEGNACSTHMDVTARRTSFIQLPHNRHRRFRVR